MPERTKRSRGLLVKVRPAPAPPEMTPEKVNRLELTPGSVGRSEAERVRVAAPRATLPAKVRSALETPRSRLPLRVTGLGRVTATGEGVLPALTALLAMVPPLTVKVPLPRALPFRTSTVPAFRVVPPV